ncbi:MAG: valine--tRNA ligase, partial [Gammaproteobacteria bacterium]|nr:valine--tRNA ligase [Gammaproteobacteria bacterium]
IMHCPYPTADQQKIDQAAITEMNWIQAVISGVRNIRGEMNISPGKELPVLIEGADQAALQILAANRPYLNKFGRFESITVLSSGEVAPESATALVGEMRVLVPLGSFIDAHAEITRLSKELEKTQSNIASVTGRLSNKAFTDKAPPAIIAKAEQQLSEAESARRLLLEQIERMQQFVK